jgi:hypothetical protein
MSVLTGIVSFESGQNPCAVAINNDRSPGPGHIRRAALEAMVAGCYTAPTDVLGCRSHCASRPSRVEYELLAKIAPEATISAYRRCYSRHRDSGQYYFLIHNQFSFVAKMRGGMDAKKRRE